LVGNPDSGFYFYGCWFKLQISPMAKRSPAAILRKLEARLRKKQRAIDKKRAKEAVRKKIEAARKKLYGR